MTEDEQAQRAVEMLAGLKRCANCDRLGTDLFPAVVEPPSGPLLCPNCWWEPRDNLTEMLRQYIARQ